MSNDISFTRIQAPQEYEILAFQKGLLYDENLTGNALKLILIMLDYGKSANWVFRQKHLLFVSKFGHEKYTNAINCLINAGYVRRLRTRLKNGRWGAYNYEFSSFPIFKQENLDGNTENKQAHNEYEPVRESRTGKSEPEKSTYIPRSLPRYLSINIQDLGREKKNTASFSKKEKNSGISNYKDPVKRWRLTQEQADAFNWLKLKQIDAEDGKLAYWAKNYSLERISDVYNEAKKNKAKSMNRYMSKIFDNNSPVQNARIMANYEFAKDFAKANGWHSLKILKRYVKFPMGRATDEISLDMDSMEFINRLIEKFENSSKQND